MSEPIEQQSTHERPTHGLTLVSPEEISRESLPDISLEQIQSEEVQRLVRDMRLFLEEQGPNGVGLAAPQVGHNLPIAVLHIVPPPAAQERGITVFEAVIINPSFEGVGDRVDSWQACMTTGSGPEDPTVNVPSYNAIQATWTDEQGELHTQELTGPHAIIFQHETRHLRGGLITDGVDPTDPNDPRVRTVGEHQKRMQAARAGVGSTATGKSVSR